MSPNATRDELALHHLRVHIPWLAGCAWDVKRRLWGQKDESEDGDNYDVGEETWKNGTAPDGQTNEGSGGGDERSAADTRMSDDQQATPASSPYSTFNREREREREHGREHDHEEGHDQSGSRLAIQIPIITTTLNPFTTFFFFWYGRHYMLRSRTGAGASHTNHVSFVLAILYVKVYVFFARRDYCVPHTTWLTDALISCTISLPHT